MRLAALVLLTAVLLDRAGADPPAVPRAGEAALGSDLVTLTSPAMEGLHPGGRGLESAVSWIAERFREAGLHPLGPDSTWFLEVEAYTNIRPQGTNGMRDQRRAYPAITSWFPLGFSAEGRLDQAGLVFAGFGLRLPSLGLDEYEAIDPTGCVVLVLDEGPSEGEWVPGALRRRKADWARDRGAVGILFVAPRDPEHPDRGGPSLDVIPLEDLFVDCRILAAEILQETADSLLSGSDFRIGRPRRGEESSIRRGPVPDLWLDWITSLRRQKATLRNVAGAIPGSEPGWVLVQAPCQGSPRRAGAADEAVLYPEANGVAAGLSVLVDLARRLGSVRHGTGRSVALAATALTEQEQEGAATVATALSLTGQPVDAVVAIDRIGRLDGGLHAAGGPDRTVWETLLARRVPAVRFDLDPALAGDALPLSRSDVPYLYLRGDADPDAGTVRDRLDRLNVSDLSRVSILLDALVRDLAEPAVFP